MGRLLSLLGSSIGRKVVVAAAGLLLCGFLVTHLAGNLFLLVGEGMFNHYAETLESNKLLPIAEIGLLALFLLHILVSLKLRYENRRARPLAYAQERSKGGRSVGSRTMTWSALLVLAFLIVHVKTFRFGVHGDSLFRMVLTSFANPLYTGFYVLAMVGLGLHLSHGVQSAFQTFGLNHPKYTPLVRAGGFLFAFAISAGFAFLPVWAYLQGGAR
jgi:succinate dehydrogenase / fumarate reductase, cytochrome b subunit